MLCRKSFKYKYARGGSEVVLNREDFDDLVFSYHIYFLVKQTIMELLKKKPGSVNVLMTLLDLLDDNDRPIVFSKPGELEGEE